MCQGRNNIEINMAEDSVTYLQKAIIPMTRGGSMSGYEKKRFEEELLELVIAAAFSAVITGTFSSVAMLSPV